MAHFVRGDLSTQNRSSAGLAYNIPEWQATKAYEINDIVMESGTMYRRNSFNYPSTSNATFDAGEQLEWTPFADDGFANSADSQSGSTWTNGASYSTGEIIRWSDGDSDYVFVAATDFTADDTRPLFHSTASDIIRLGLDQRGVIRGYDFADSPVTMAQTSDMGAVKCGVDSSGGPMVINLPPYTSTNFTRANTYVVITDVGGNFGTNNVTVNTGNPTHQFQDGSSSMVLSEPYGTWIFFANHSSPGADAWHVISGTMQPSSGGAADGGAKAWAASTAYIAGDLIIGDGSGDASVGAQWVAMYATADFTSGTVSLWDDALNIGSLDIVSIDSYVSGASNGLSGNTINLNASVFFTPTTLRTSGAGGSGPATFILPERSVQSWTEYHPIAFRLVDEAGFAGTDGITLTCSGTDTFADGSTSKTLTVANGSWLIIPHYFSGGVYGWLVIGDADGGGGGGLAMNVGSSQQTAPDAVISNWEKLVGGNNVFVTGLDAFNQIGLDTNIKYVSFPDGAAPTAFSGNKVYGIQSQSAPRTFGLPNSGLFHQFTGSIDHIPTKFLFVDEGGTLSTNSITLSSGSAIYGPSVLDVDGGVWSAEALADSDAWVVTQLYPSSGGAVTGAATATVTFTSGQWTGAGPITLVVPAATHTLGTDIATVQTFSGSAAPFTQVDIDTSIDAAGQITLTSAGASFDGRVSIVSGSTPIAL